MTGPALDIAALTGVRSGKRSYYPAYRRSAERMQRAVLAMDTISSALVRTVEGPRALLVDVLQAAADHLQGRWVLIALRDGALVDARPRFLAVAREGAGEGAGEAPRAAGAPGGRGNLTTGAAARVVDTEDELPIAVRDELESLRIGELAGPPVDPLGWVRAPMVLDGSCVGGLVGLHGLESTEPADLSVLRIIANQAAVSMHTSALYEAGLALRRRAQHLHDEASQQAHDLAERTRELHRVEQRLLVAHQRELLDVERHRIARELHDSVTQYVLSAGMAVDVCRSDVAALGPLPRPDAADSVDGIRRRLDEAKDLTRRAVNQLRSAIYALHHTDSGEEPAGLPELLAEVAGQHSQHLAVSLRVHGVPRSLGAEAEQSLARVAGEALFNVAVHARASRAVVRLRYRPDTVWLTVSDDGCGDPSQLRRLLRVESAADADGRHRGLANMASRAHELGGTFRVRRSRLGGVLVHVAVPDAAVPDAAAPDTAAPDTVTADAAAPDGPALPVGDPA